MLCIEELSMFTVYIVNFITVLHVQQIAYAVIFHSKFVNLHKFRHWYNCRNDLIVLTYSTYCMLFILSGMFGTHFTLDFVC